MREESGEKEIRCCLCGEALGVEDEVYCRACLEHSEDERYHQGYDEGYRQGYDEGYEKGLEEGRREGRDSVISQIESDIIIPYEIRRRILDRY